MNRQPANEQLGYSDTPVLEDSGYHVHDGTRPQPRTVAPGRDGGPPSDAIVLFDGSDLHNWQGRDGEAPWKVERDYMEVEPKTGDIWTKQRFGDVQLHIEFACPREVKGDGQGRGNSGVFLMGKYEIQVLDNYQNPTYADGTVGAIYGQYPPLANAIRKPAEWNVYDIIWSAPAFSGARLASPARATVLLNNVLLHHDTPLYGQTGHKTSPVYEPHAARGPLLLQNHGDLVRFRNIWVRELSAYDS